MNNQEKADEQSIKKLFIGKCWSYLNGNFHKFNQTNQIKIALELVKKDIPQEVTGMEMKQIVIMQEIKKDNEPLRFNIGDPDTKQAVGHTQQATSIH